MGIRKEIFPAYVEADLAKNKIVKPPRNRKKEVSVYFHRTQLDIDVISDTTTQKTVNATLSQELKFNITTPLNFDITGVKTGDISDSIPWSTQLNGFIFEEILSYDADKYNFITFSILQSSTIALTKKYRIVDYKPIYDNDNKFIYASLAIIQETSKSFPNLSKTSWNLVSQVIVDAKTKFLKFTLPAKTQLHAQGLKVQVTDDQGVDRNPGIIVNSISETLTYKLIKVRNANPYIFDDLTFKNFKELNYSHEFSGNLPGLAFWFNGGTIFGQPNAYPDPSQTSTKLTIPISGTDVNSRQDGYREYFSSGLLCKAGNDEGKDAFNTSGTITITERPMNTTELQTFLTGNTVVDGATIPADSSDTVTTFPPTNKLGDLDIASESDRKYFVATKRTDFKKTPVRVVKWDLDSPSGTVKNQFTGVAYIDAKYTLKGGGFPVPTSTFGSQVNNDGDFPNPNFASSYRNDKFKCELIRLDEITDAFLNPDDDIVIEIELSQDGKSPLIELETSAADSVQISTYDENHRLIFDNQRYDTEFSFNNGKKLTKIQM